MNKRGQGQGNAGGGGRFNKGGNNKGSTQQQYKEDGYYDSYGFYIIKNGSYYDPQGRFFDVDGYDETGGYYQGSKYIPGNLPPKSTNSNYDVKNSKQKDFVSNSNSNSAVSSTVTQVQSSQKSQNISNQTEKKEDSKVVSSSDKGSQNSSEQKASKDKQEKQLVKTISDEFNEDIDQLKSKVKSLALATNEDVEIQTLEGARIRDICPSSKWCKDQMCIRYHPAWMQRYCFGFLNSDCRSTRCQQEHKHWNDLVRLIKQNETYDIFTKSPFKKVEMFRIIGSQSRGGYQGPRKDYDYYRQFYEPPKAQVKLEKTEYSILFESQEKQTNSKNNSPKKSSQRNSDVSEPAMSKRNSKEIKTNTPLNNEQKQSEQEFQPAKVEVDVKKIMEAQEFKPTKKTSQPFAPQFNQTTFTEFQPNTSFQQADANAFNYQPQFQQDYQQMVPPEQYDQWDYNQTDEYGYQQDYTQSQQYTQNYDPITIGGEFIPQTGIQQQYPVQQTPIYQYDQFQPQQQPMYGQSSTPFIPQKKAFVPDYNQYNQFQQQQMEQPIQYQEDYKQQEYDYSQTNTFQNYQNSGTFVPRRY
ncbi:UNKNOWN [Stylonychia lemnae]|uniref:Uncharacterized protein n=1 Tax=Stylonychia lemnae TaxID=5949 RepID=A0A078AXF9_STYLE|nr:UNKNOWN [Stylonychia lemnae]|eukprot:CDW85912.1 UNKNOWN [Stylonychia lemnae]